MSRALVRMVESTPGLLAPWEGIVAAGRGRTVPGTESAGRLPTTTIWAVSDRRLFVFDDVRRRRRGTGRLVEVHDVAEAVDAWGVQPFDDRDVLFGVTVGDGTLLVVMDPGDARALVAALDVAAGRVSAADGAAPAAPDPGADGPGGRSSRVRDAEPVDDTPGGGAAPGGVRAALAVGDWAAARDRLAAAGVPSAREWIVRNLAGRDLVAGIEAWVAAEPDDPDVYLVRGAHAVASALGRGNPGGEAFFEELRFGERNLWWALESAFDDPVALTPLIRSGAALDIPTEELVLRFGEVERRSPGLPGAHLEMVVALGTSRRSSVAEMDAFVAAVGGSVPEGSPTHAIVPLAHLIAEDRSASGVQRRRSLSAEARADLQITFAMTLDSDRWDPGPGAIETRNILAAALARSGETARASALLGDTPTPPTRLPWSVLSDGAELYRSVVATPG